MIMQRSVRDNMRLLIVLYYSYSNPFMYFSLSASGYDLVMFVETIVRVNFLLKLIWVFAAHLRWPGHILFYVLYRVLLNVSAIVYTQVQSTSVQQTYRFG